MPMFYFDVLDSDQVIVDDLGEVLPDLEAARLAAVRGAREIIAEAAKGGRNILHYGFRVRDGAGDIVLTVTFEETLRRP
jgi:hypothetical protein